MPTNTPPGSPTLEAFVDLFRALSALGIEPVVIGGMAVGAYARLVGQTVMSQDLDLFVDTTGLQEVLVRVDELGARIEKRRWRSRVQVPLPRRMSIDRTERPVVARRIAKTKEIGVSVEPSSVQLALHTEIATVQIRPQNRADLIDIQVNFAVFWRPTSQEHACE